MSKAKQKKKEFISPHPRQAAIMLGHDTAFELLKKNFDSGKMQHAWMITGAKGIGKATLAYKMAHYILSGNNPKGAYAKIINNSHSDLLVIENDGEGKEIKIETTRKLASFLHVTSSETGYRVIIIDSVDELNNNAANSILKLLEEPPLNTIMLLISHAPGGLLPTIRSRCRMLKLRPPSASTARKIVSGLIPDIESNDLDDILYLAGNSPGGAVQLYFNNGLAVYNKICAILNGLPSINNIEVYKLGEEIAGKNPEDWRIVISMLQFVLAKIIKNATTGEMIRAVYGSENNIAAKILSGHNVEQLINYWNEISDLAISAEHINLDKKMVLFKIFNMFTG